MNLPLSAAIEQAVVTDAPIAHAPTTEHPPSPEDLLTLLKETCDIAPDTGLSVARNIANLAASTIGDLQTRSQEEFKRAETDFNRSIAYNPKSWLIAWTRWCMGSTTSTYPGHMDLHFGAKRGKHWKAVATKLYEVEKAHKEFVLQVNALIDAQLRKSKNPDFLDLEEKLQEVEQAIEATQQQIDQQARNASGDDLEYTLTAGLLGNSSTYHAESDTYDSRQYLQNLETQRDIIIEQIETIRSKIRNTILN